MYWYTLPCSRLRDYFFTFYFRDGDGVFMHPLHPASHGHDDVVDDDVYVGVGGGPLSRAVWWQLIRPRQSVANVAVKDTRTRRRLRRAVVPAPAALITQSTTAVLCTTSNWTHAVICSVNEVLSRAVFVRFSLGGQSFDWL